MSSVLILDPYLARDFVAARHASGGDQFDEVWDGRIVVPPMPNNEHFRLVTKLVEPFSAVIDWDRGDQALPGGNVSDRDDGWQHNYRNPDILVALAGGAAIDRGTYWRGGPDLVVEIISPGENPHDKFGFYAQVSTREVLIVDRDPWALELYQLCGGKLVLAGRSDLSNSAVLTSSVLPLTFRLVAGQSRPRIEVVHPPTGRRWEA